MQILASLDADLQPYELSSQDVNLCWKQQDGGYVRAEHVVRMIDLLGWNDPALALNCIQSVTVDDAPAGQVITGYTLAVDTNGVITAAVTYSPAAVVVPSIISRMQAQLALHATASLTKAGKTALDDVNAAVAATSDPTVTIYWNTAAAFDRQHPKLLALVSLLGWSSAYVDQLFTAAAQLS